MEISIFKAGLLTTVQDLGRFNYRSDGVPLSGAMDLFSARLANIALNNADDLATIEFTYAAAEFIADTDILIAYAGDGATLVTNEIKLPQHRPIFLPKGSIVKLQNNNNGARTYLAVAGGWDIPNVLGSRSTYLTAGFGGYNGRALQTKDQLSNIEKHVDNTLQIYNQLKGDKVNFTKWGISTRMLSTSNRKTIRIIMGRESAWFDQKSITNLLSTPYKTGIDSNRMGINLEGQIMERNKKEELLSTAVIPGTIQVTGSGKMVLLMADCQTTGGYPRIAQVATVDLTLCAQLKPGDMIQFIEISQQASEKLYIERELEINAIKIAVNTRF
ncbi:biotin-dependent carboxyltransferase family protein [Pedobacter sp. GSP4]|uniref:5-oxoprolinase subunit C family protein n=1 Tax=Pedobacter sp. GSP4 TaxID=3453716 RepID=UPI003EEB5749